MTTYPTNLGNPPIREALLDVRMDVPLLGDLDARFDRIHEGLRDAYPDAKKLHRAETELAIEDDQPSATTKSTVIGRIYWNQDRSRAVQARTDGFTLNVIRSYPGWESFDAAARSAWDVVAPALEPNRITRLAVRFINEIRIPVGDELSKWIRVAPSLPPGLPSVTNEFRLRVVLPLRDQTTAILTLGLPPPPGGDRAGTLTVDIDVFTTGSWPLSDASLWDEFSRLRNDKNRCFFESLVEERWGEFA